ncbi:MAG: Ig-like domain-containing protein [Ruminococcus sp.]
MKGNTFLKRLICCAVSAAVLICSCGFSAVPVYGAGDWDGSADTSWYNERDTKFTLTTADQLAGLAVLVNEEKDNFAGKTIYLGGNITFNANADIDAWSEGINIPMNDWIPIGLLYATPFKGTFDGCGYSISGLYSAQSGNVAGLFGYIGRGSEVRNINLESGYIYSINHYAGGICAYSHYAAVRDVHNSAYVRSEYYRAGGITGVNSGSELICCSNKGTVKGGKAAGGIMGEICSVGSAESCFNEGIVSSAKCAGGICGIMNNGTVLGCYNTGTISGKEIAGGIAGSGGAENEIKNTYSIGKVSSESGEGYGINGGGSIKCTGCYYLSGSALKGECEGVKTVSDAVVKQELAGMLDNHFIKGSMYPLLAWQNDVNDPAYTTESTTATSVTTTAATTTASSVTTTVSTTAESTSSVTETSGTTLSTEGTGAIRIWAVNNVTELHGIGSKVQLLIDGNTNIPQWATMNKDIAVVDSNGLVTATGEGKVTIVATVDGIAVMTELTVTGEEATSESTTTTTTTTATTTTTTTTTIPAYSLGDCDGNNVIDISDAVLVLMYYSRAAAGLEASFSENEQLNMLAFYAADVSRSGSIGLDDAGMILSYYSQIAAGMVPEWR